MAFAAAHVLNTQYTFPNPIAASGIMADFSSIVITSKSHQKSNPVIQQHNLPLDDATEAALEDVWIRVRDMFILPPGMTMLEQFLRFMNDYYILDGLGSIGGWDVYKPGECQITCVSTTQLPQAYEYGILYGLCCRFVPDDFVFSIEVIPNSNTNTSTPDSVTYHIRVFPF